MSLDAFGNYVPGQFFNFTPLSGGSDSGFSGAGSPEGVTTASVGSLYWDTVGQTLYVKNTGTGNTGWVLSFGGVTTLNGSGSPEGVATANPGWTYFDVTNSVLYLKKTGTGNTGWQNMAGA